MLENLVDSLRRNLSRRSLASAAAVIAASVALAAAGSATASNGLALAIFDDAATLDPAKATFSTLDTLHVQIVRMTLVWGGPGGVANTQPTHPTDPTDPAYQWTRYDEAIEQASGHGMSVLLTIVGTPAWANDGGRPQLPPTSATALRRFAYAAARRYSGTFLDAATGRILPRVGKWLAWNEPNNPVFLQPQFAWKNGKWQMTSAAAYAGICNAIYAGVHAAGGPAEVACGATAPRGSNSPHGSRPSISPLAFLRAAKKAGLRRFDAWAHHPYYGSPSETPTTRLVGTRAVGLGNIDALIAEVTRLYGRKPLWITEYGYQTKPPDEFFGVSPTKQATYLRDAYEIALENPRIDLFTWFLLKDSTDINGWQSGLMTASGHAKPSFAAFAALRSGSV